ncbi:GtrA family protein [Collinsella tanakaei]|uniref:GtrA family protein n=1 Tax=Collinsella tanakaei TaxID=626935 RepID=UPI0025A499E8|nr:GtrA family protein [Collinsella tanakaei]MDM8302172.1 GtrA family protein [Collinsella tanakaei]
MRNALNKPTAKQFTKFALVGFTSLAVDYLLLIALVELLHVDYLVGTTLAFIASVVVNYFLSMRFVFVRRDDLSRKREFTIFALLSAIGLGLNDLFMFVGVAFLSVGYQAMKLISTFMVTWYNYFSRRRFLDGGHA